MTVSIALQRARALRAIDEAAGEARLRYITEVPGQQAVYMLKLAEARAHIEGAEPGPHLVAVAATMGRTTQNVAAEIAQIASVWEQILSPAIEAQRLSGKAAVMNASQAELGALVDSTLQALQAL
jgi:hypothetical protein